MAMKKSAETVNAAVRPNLYAWNHKRDDIKWYMAQSRSTNTAAATQTGVMLALLAAAAQRQRSHTAEREAETVEQHKSEDTARAFAFTMPKSWQKGKS
ncbi:MAG: hypothetical protein ACLVJ6_04295 [Merdibacter sp.]